MAKKDVDLFGTLNRLQKKLGLPTLTVKLHELDLLHGDKDEESIKNIVIEEVCTACGIEVSYLMNKRLHSRDEKKQIATDLICAILKDNFVWDLNKIKVIFGIHESNVSRRICSVRLLDKTNKMDEKITKIHEKVLDNLKKKKLIK